MSQRQSNIELRTVKQQYASVVQTLRRICNPIPALTAEFDRGYREAIANFEVDAFLAGGCSLSGAHLTRAAKAGCASAVDFINANFQPLSTQHTNILSQLTSEMVCIALDGLTIAPAIASFRPGSIQPLGSSQPVRTTPPPQPTRCVPPSRRPSDTEIANALQQVDTANVHYLGCPNPTVRCNTCSSAFSLLNVTPCSHRGDWCTGVGYYPHFTARLMRKFAHLHSCNQALVQADLGMTTPSEVGTQASARSSQHTVQTDPAVDESSQTTRRSATGPSWIQTVEDELAQTQAMVTVGRDDMDMSAPSDVGVNDSISNVGSRVREPTPSSSSFTQRRPPQRVQTRSKRGRNDKRSGEPPRKR